MLVTYTEEEAEDNIFPWKVELNVNVGELNTLQKL